MERFLMTSEEQSGVRGTARKISRNGMDGKGSRPDIFLKLALRCAADLPQHRRLAFLFIQRAIALPNARLPAAEGLPCAQAS